MRTAWLLALVLVLPGLVRAETIGTLSLDSLSFVAFESFENVSLPSGSTIRFRFGDVSSSGSAAFSIQPADVAIAPIAVRPDVTLTYTLANPATGTIRRMSGAVQIDFEGSIHAALSQPDGGGTATYVLHFTTREATATNAAQTETVEVEGMPVVQGANYVQLVGGATNRPDAFPGPGAAVYSVLSGTFDALPQLP